MTALDELMAFVPSAPTWRLDYAGLREQFDWVAALDTCPQDRTFHAEGNVGVHTEMVCAELVASSGYRALPRLDQEVVFLASLMHDVAKPACTRVEDDGRISAQGHSHRGDITTRRILWELGADIAVRERVAGLVRYHQIPFFLLEKDDPQRLAYRISLVTRCDLLTLVARADAAGRRCTNPGDRDRLLEACELFDDYCAEQECRDAPKSFPSAHSRFLYFRKPDRDPGYHAHDDTRSRVTIVCGLPAVGKDHWIRENVPGLPCVSLDALRKQLDIDPRDRQGPVVEAARQLARYHLRAGDSFVWNATNVSRDVRSRILDLCADYNAWIDVVHVETTPENLHRRNRARARPVPVDAIARMLERWTVTDRTEAHRVRLVQT